jgi:predicted anti-sigma-YlaC factor YlaD
MKEHYTEADLLETYYTQAGESMPVMMHLADCSDCAARYERLDRKLRSLAACDHQKPETFWARQRMAVMRRIDGRRTRKSVAGRLVAAAALVVVLGGGVITWKNSTGAPATEITAEVNADLSVPTDPWQSDELKDLQSVVAWESWVEPSKGDQSL